MNVSLRSYVSLALVLLQRPSFARSIRLHRLRAGRACRVSRAMTSSRLGDAGAQRTRGVQLLVTMVAYFSTFSLGENVVVPIDTSWNRPDRTDQIRHFVLEGAC